MNKLLTHSCIFIFLFICYFISYSSILSGTSQNAFTEDEDKVWFANLSPIFVEIIAGEFKGIFSSFIALDVGARLGTRIVRDRQGKFLRVKLKRNWPAIHKLFTLSQTLDPAFQQTYYVAQGWLPWEAKMIKETQLILQTAANNRHWDWRPLHFQAFNSYYFLTDYAHAGRLMLEAAMIDQAPPFLGLLGARLSQKGNDTATAIDLLTQMLETKEKKSPGYDELVNRLNALKAVKILEHASIRFKNMTGSYPKSLEHILESGLLKAIPKNPYKVDFCLTAEGKVLFDELKCPKWP